jgi:2-keto-4-pentenoate hydratase/2-oxohepta-3-ene-1,7-dioic acid hydratase in catechol pathway
MRRILVALAILLLFWVSAWQIAARWPQDAASAVMAPSDPPDMRNLPLAARTEALTFARFMQGGELRLLLVEALRDDRVSGIDLQQRLPGSTADPVDLFNQHGYEALSHLDGPVVSVDVSALVLPFTGTDNQIAVGINYPAHGVESDVSESFLFPKRTLATPFRSGVPVRGHLLDYELELGFVLLQDLSREHEPDHVGLVLASDYTDRAELARRVRLTDVSSGDGFTQGKSPAGFMPVGNLLVIPKDYQNFYRQLDLRLWHNGSLRQAARPVEMSWNINRILQETFARAGRRWQWQDQLVALPVVNDRIPARTMILSGTPDGVIYRKPSPRQLFVGLSEMVFTLQWTNLHAVIEPFLREEYRSGRYLAAGDVVQMRADRLGMISNTIVAGED